MRYTGQFKTFETDRTYTVEIITNGDSSKTTEVDLGDEPFTTSMDSDGDTIYKTAKYQSATIKIVMDKYYFDLYAKTVHQNSVKLYNQNNDVVWTGWCTPNAYDNSWAGGNQEEEIECVDGLASLKNIKYEPVNGYSDRRVMPMVKIIDSILQKCECYKTFYMSHNTRLSKEDNNPIINKLLVSENNFFDTKDDETETDKDVAWKCSDVLESICQFLNVTVIACGEDVYFLDYDAIKNNVNTYVHYTIGGDTDTYTKVDLSNTINYGMQNNADNKPKISLDDVYNKATVTVNLNDYDTVLPDFFDEAVNITSSDDYYLRTSENINNGMYGEVVSNEVGNTLKQKNLNMICMLDRPYDPQSKKYKALNAVFAKYFNNPYYKFYKYKWDGNSLKDVTETVKEMNYTDTVNSSDLYGSTLAKFSVTKMDKQYNWIEQIVMEIMGEKISLDSYLAKNDVTSISFTNYILMLNPDSHHISNDDILKYPYFETVATNSNALYGGDNVYLMISGSYYYHSFPKDPYPIPEGQVDIKEGRYAMYQDETYLLCKLEFNGKYWNGEDWVTSPNATFKLWYMKTDTSKSDRRADATMFHNLEFRSTVNWRVGTDSKGYAIKLPSTSVINGAPKLTVYKPYDPHYSTKSGHGKGQHYKHYVVLLKDFSIKCIVGDPTFSNDNDTDTKYTNIINSDYVNALDEIEFKVNTWDNKKPNFSSVAYMGSDTNMHYLDKTYNTALDDEERK